MFEEASQVKENQSMKDGLESFFLLKKSSSHSTVSIEVDFSPNHIKSESSNTSPLKASPTFHSDGNYFTPSFILEVDQVRYYLFRKDMKKIFRFIETFIIENQCKFQNKNRNQYNLNLLQFVPKPSKNNSFCCVCKVPFEDYLSVLFYLLSILINQNIDICSKNQNIV